MLIWTGAGILVVLLGLAGIGTSAAIFALLGQDLGQNENIFPPIGFLIGAVYTYLFYKYVLAKREKPRHLQDPATGKPVVIKRNSTFMFIPFRFWPYVMATIGLVTLIVALVS